MLCEKCSSIHFQNIRDCDVVKRDPERLTLVKGTSCQPTTLEKRTGFDTSDDLFYFHHCDKQALERSAETGCHFCFMIWEALFGSLRGYGGLPPWTFARGEVILGLHLIDPRIKKHADSDFEYDDRSFSFNIQCEDRYVGVTARKLCSGKI